SMGGKWLELLKEVAPQVERVGLVVYPETAASIGFFKFAEALAPALKVKLVALGVHDADEIKQVLTAFAAEGNGGLIVTPHAVTLTNRDLIVALCARLRLPALYPLVFLCQSGRTDFVWLRCAPPISAGGGICRPHTARCQACRPASAVSDEVSARYQPEDRQDDRADNSGVVSAARRRGDRVKRREFIALLGGGCASP